MDTHRLVESGGDHFYGAWEGGKASSGGHPEAMGHELSAHAGHDEQKRLAAHPDKVEVHPDGQAVTITKGKASATFNRVGDIWYMTAHSQGIWAPDVANSVSAMLTKAAKAEADKAAKATPALTDAGKAWDWQWKPLHEASDDDHYYGAWWGGKGGHPIPAGMTTVAAAAHAMRLAAVKNEPQVTADLQTISGKVGATMQGLDARLKGEDRLAEKIAADARDKNLTIPEAAGGINDSLRYTMVADDSTYRDTFQSAYTDLLRKGYAPLGGKAPKNFWDHEPPPAVYQGVNAVFEKPGTDIRFELQFHTPESVATARSQHVLYEAWRTSSSPDERASLWLQMEANQNTVPVPGGWPPSGVQLRNP
jgi:hypothetical protein